MALCTIFVQNAHIPILKLKRFRETKTFELLRSHKSRKSDPIYCHIFDITVGDKVEKI